MEPIVIKVKDIQPGDLMKPNGHGDTTETVSHLTFEGRRVRIHFIGGRTRVEYSAGRRRTVRRP